MYVTHWNEHDNNMMCISMHVREEFTAEEKKNI